MNQQVVIFTLRIHFKKHSVRPISSTVHVAFCLHTPEKQTQLQLSAKTDQWRSDARSFPLQLKQVAFVPFVTPQTFHFLNCFYCTAQWNPCACTVQKKNKNNKLTTSDDNRLASIKGQLAWFRDTHNSPQTLLISCLTGGRDNRRLAQPAERRAKWAERFVNVTFGQSSA